MKNIKKILTAIGNPILNNELKKINYLDVTNNDILYQEGIFENLEINSEVDFIILSQLIPGELSLEDLIEKIHIINNKIKIIIFLEKYDSNLENILIKKGVYRILYDTKIEIEDIIKIINEDDKMEKYNAEIKREIDELKKYIINNKNDEKNKDINIQKNIKKKSKKYNEKNNIKNIIENKIKNNIKNKIKNNINKKIKNNYLLKNKFKIMNNYFTNNEKQKNNKIISVLGNNGSGKSMFTVMLANGMKKYLNKILIIDFDILNNSLHTILGVKKYSEKINKIINNNNYNNKINVENLIININKKIDLISGINLLFDSVNKISEEKFKNILKKLKEYYDLIIIDTTSECFFEYTKEIIKTSDESIFLTEANLLEVSKSKRLLDIYYNNWNIEKNKINIIFNKFNKNSIDIKLLKKLYSDYKILGIIKLKNNFNLIINKNIKNIILENKLIKNYEFICKKII